MQHAYSHRLLNAVYSAYGAIFGVLPSHTPSPSPQLLQSTSFASAFSPYFGYLWWANRSAMLLTASSQLDTRPRSLFIHPRLNQEWQPERQSDYTKLGTKWAFGAPVGAIKGGMVRVSLISSLQLHHVLLEHELTHGPFPFTQRLAVHLCAGQLCDNLFPQN